jgi:uncharacterized damage-inducible protein DinB
MSIAESMLPEFDHEMGTTRKVLAAVPDAALDWSPHAKSMSLRSLATHLANMPTWCSLILTHPEFDAAASPRATPIASTEAMLATWDAGTQAVRARLADMSDDAMHAPWSLRAGAHVMFTQPRAAVIRSFVFNHMIHHRGQLTVYLRLQDVPLPEVYGPTADSRRPG